MTQEVQPLTWQKRTNIEEHRQFHDKINEIVGELSGTVERSEAAVATAHQAVVDAEDAVVEATAAIRRADHSIETANIAVSRADTALAGVATYDGRLTAAESGVAANRADIGHLGIETRDLYDRDAQSIKHSDVETLTWGAASRLTGSTGSAGKPIYLKDGVPTVATNVATLGANEFASSQTVPAPYGGGYSTVLKGGIDEVAHGAGYASLVSLRSGSILIYCEKDVVASDGTVDAVLKCFRSPDGTDYYIQEYQKNSEGIMIPTYNRAFPADAPGQTLITKGWAENTDGVTNNLMHRSANEKTIGRKEGWWCGTIMDAPVNPTDMSHWLIYATCEYHQAFDTSSRIIEFVGLNNNSVCYSKVLYAHASRCYPIINEPGIAGSKIVSLTNPITGRDEIWIKGTTEGGRSGPAGIRMEVTGNTSYITVVNEDGGTSLPEGATHVKYLLGAE